MILLNTHQLEKSFANKVLFREVSFGIEDGEKVALVGPNGAGKSTLIKILAGQGEAEGGRVTRKKGLRMGLLDQTPEFQPNATILSTLLEKCPDKDEALGKAYELMGVLELIGFGEEFPVAQLSGGWKKRVALARELMHEPELLLLDEPTNHLDVESILWLEEYIHAASFAVLMITHDRLFLQRVATRVLDLDPRNPHYLLDIPGDYVQYTETKEQELHALARQEKVLKNTLRREVEWLRRGAKARQTKQQARIQSAHQLADDVEALQAKNQHKVVNLDFGQTEKSPKKLIEAIEISKSYGERVLFENESLIIGPKTRLAILGHNGCGKSTLVRALLGLEEVDKGEVRIGATTSRTIEIAYFEQGRETLDPKASVLRNICKEGDFVSYRGTPIHVRSYLDRFMFSGSKVDLPVAKLSGGEQARLRLAQLMLREAQVLVLDEPTNDLDADTLNVLETALAEFQGAVILVTHDRYFMDAVSNQILAFPPEGSRNKKLEKFASYFQWEEWFVAAKAAVANGQEAKAYEAAQAAAQKPGGAASLATGGAAAGVSAQTATPTKKEKLTFKEKHELETMEAGIFKLEEDLKSLTEKSVDPSLNQNHTEMSRVHSELARLQSEIDAKYARWAELEKKI
jgi:ATP-binding cassette subfamily F protein uup